MRGNFASKVKRMSVVAGFIVAMAVSCDSGSGDGSVLDKAYNAAKEAGNRQPVTTLPEPSVCHEGVFTYNCAQ